MRFGSFHIRKPILAIVLLPVILFSCSYQHYKGFEPVTTVHINVPVIFDAPFEKAVYTTTFRVYKQELSGLTIVKRTHADSTIHVVFMSQIGLKFFDVEIRQNEPKDWFRVNYIIKSLNRDIVVSSLKTDLMLLFLQYPENYAAAVFRAPENKGQETTIRFENYISSVFSDAANQVTGIVFRKGHGVKTTIHITPGKDYPESLDINNKNGGPDISWKEIVM